MKRTLLRANINGGGEAQALINNVNALRQIKRTLALAQASKMYPGARAGVKVPELTRIETRYPYDIYQIRAPITYAKKPLIARYLLDF